MARMFSRGVSGLIFAAGDQAARRRAQVVEDLLHVGAHLRRRAEGHDLLPVEVRAEAHPAGVVLLQHVVADHAGLAVEHLHSQVQQVGEDVEDVAVGVEVHVHPRVAHLVEHGAIDRLEELPPQLRGDQQLLLGAPVVGEVQPVVLVLQPAVDPAQVELQQVVAQAVDLLGLVGQVHQEVLHAAQLLHLLEEGDPGPARVPVPAAAGHVAAVEAPLGRAGAELRPAEARVGGPVGQGPLHRDAADPLVVHRPQGAEVVPVQAALVQGRVVLALQVRQIGPAEVLVHAGQDLLQRAPVLELGRGQDAVGDGRPVRVVETDRALDPFAAVHALCSLQDSRTMSRGWIRKWWAWPLAFRSIRSSRPVAAISPILYLDWCTVVSGTRRKGAR